MRVLIVEPEPELGALWRRHLQRFMLDVDLVLSQEAAIEKIQQHAYEIILLDVVLTKGSAFAVSDFANYRSPDTRVIFVTNSSFFSDGSIFAHSSNACAFVPSSTRPDDLAMMVEHYAQS